MKIKSTFAALVLTILPGMAIAEGCSGLMHDTTTAMSCAEGTVMDSETGACVPVVTG